MNNLANIVFWVAVGALGILLIHAAQRLVRSAWRLVDAAADDNRLSRLIGPGCLVVLAGAALAAYPFARVGLGLSGWVQQALGIGLGVGVTWLSATLLGVVVRTLLTLYDTSTTDNLAARRVHTQYRVLLRIGLILVWTVGAAVILSTFPAVRNLGNGLLASAGLVGLVLGLAAQRTIGNFLAGIQIALTQPIRLDDAVVIDGEWGWIEDITTTYVVVKIWDERRLIVPFSKLLEAPFQNWTRTRADLLGSVTLWTHYRAPVPALRQELHRVLGETDLWDGRVAVLQVTDANERAIQLRALVSASTSPKAWDLRCFVREKLLSFLVREHPAALPAVRAEVEPRGRGRDLPAVPAGLAEPDVGGLPGEPEPGGRDRPEGRV